MSEFVGKIYVEYPHDEDLCGASDVKLKSDDYDEAHQELEDYILTNYTDNEQNLIIKTEILDVEDDSDDDSEDVYARLNQDDDHPMMIYGDSYEDTEGIEEEEFDEEMEVEYEEDYEDEDFDDFNEED